MSKILSELVPALLAAIPVTLLVATVPMLLGAVFGILLALVRIMKIPVLDQLARVYVSVVRGIPLYVLLFVTYYGMPRLINWIVYQGKNVFTIQSMPSLTVALITFTIYTTAYLSEIFRGAILAVDRGQWEAGKACGMSTPITFLQVIFPQALITALPNYCNFFLGTLKQSALVFCIAVKDIMGSARVYAASSHQYIASYAIAAVFYVVLGYVIINIFRLIERQVRVRR